jgi:HSP20 family molecular chaperone IbpA
MKKFDRSHLWVSLLSFTLGILFCFVTGMFHWAQFLPPAFKTGFALKNLIHPPSSIDSTHNSEQALEDLFAEDSLFGNIAREMNFEDIRTREDQNFFYLEIPLHGKKLENFSAKVENGQILLQGESKNANDEDGTSIHFQSTFSRQFPAPPHIDPAGIQIEQKDDKVILQFPKKP